MFKILEKIKSKKNQILCSVLIASSSLMTCVTAHAEGTTTSGTDMGPITQAIQTGIGDTKTQFMAILAIAVVGGMAFFAIKYAINQGIGFFAKLSKKG